MFLFAGQMAVERVLASYTQTHREAHMASETDTGTPSRLLRGSDAKGRGHRAYVVASTTKMKEERRRRKHRGEEQ